jgi:hypothetical protein
VLDDGGVGVGPSSLSTSSLSRAVTVRDMMAVLTTSPSHSTSFSHNHQMSPGRSSAGMSRSASRTSSAERRPSARPAAPPSARSRRCHEAATAEAQDPTGAHRPARAVTTTRPVPLRIGDECHAHSRSGDCPGAVTVRAPSPTTRSNVASRSSTSNAMWPYASLNAARRGIGGPQTRRGTGAVQQFQPVAVHAVDEHHDVRGRSARPAAPPRGCSRMPRSTTRRRRRGRAPTARRGPGERIHPRTFRPSRSAVR